jgi:NAD(P)-dependent dehydrogenase (short-subunit alcohol dehydrogenase family)
MTKIILVAGGTGNLGERIVKVLLSKGAEVRVLVRSGSNKTITQKLEELGAKIITINNWTVEELMSACKNVSCVVSALAGLREVIIDAQKVLLDAAIAARVPRFIPSDYSLDFTKFNPGENRNLDWRREFHTYLDAKPIAATTIFNGAFADMLTGQMPLILFKQKKILYWGSADHKMGFTTINDTATYTAHAAFDANTPRYLRIAGDQLSAREIKAMMTAISGEKFGFIRPGGSGLLGILIKIARTMAPGKKDLYPAWQGMQYMHNMIDERSNIPVLDNDRFPAMRFTTVKELLSRHHTANTK